MESKTHDELSIMLNQEEYDDISMAESLINDTQRDTVSVTQVPSCSFVQCLLCQTMCVHEMFSVFCSLTMLELRCFTPFQAIFISYTLYVPQNNIPTI